MIAREKDVTLDSMLDSMAVSMDRERKLLERAEAMRERIFGPLPLAQTETRQEAAPDGKLGRMQSIIKARDATLFALEEVMARLEHFV